MIAARWEKEIHAALISEPKALRRAFFKKAFQSKKNISGAEIWPAAKNFLDVIERHIAGRLQGRSAIFWFHVYRRLGVMLSPEHENKTDAVTTGLVRQVVELAILKYAPLHSSELRVMSDIAMDAVLGGWMKRAFIKLAGQAATNKWKKYAKVVRNQKTVVLRDFVPRDLIDIYAVEGYAYQYWQVTALMRSVGKGAIVWIDDDGDWNYVSTSLPRQLIESFDSRSEIFNEFSSLSGLWVPSNLLVQVSADALEGKNSVYAPVYNFNRVKFEKEIRLPAFVLAAGVQPNFIPTMLNAEAFLQTHAVLDEPFKRANRFSLQELLSVLSALTSIMGIPDAAIYPDDKDAKALALSNAFVHMFKRAYAMLRQDIDRFPERLRERLDLLRLKTPEDDSLRNILNRLVLTTDMRAKIGLWSGGPRPVIIPGREMHMVDAVAIYPLLRSLFAFMRHDESKRGYAFEETVRAALTAEGFVVTSGEKISAAGQKREIDAAVQIASTLFVFECKSMERPLDFEIGNPVTIARRVEEFDSKLKQVNSACDFLRKNKKGRNYDFSNVDSFEPFVVSPFVEWIWTQDRELWYDEKTPRVVNPIEMVSLLKKLAG